MCTRRTHEQTVDVMPLVYSAGRCKHGLSIVPGFDADLYLTVGLSNLAFEGKRKAYEYAKS